MRTLRIAIASTIAFTAALALTACGSSSASPEGGTYTTNAMTVDGTEQPLALDSTLKVAFVDGGVSVNAGCNTMFSPADLSNGTITLSGPLAGTKMACPPELMAQDEALAAFFSAGPAWTLDGEVLTLSGGTTTFTLRSA
jgi:heat shock protein HslJ